MPSTLPHPKSPLLESASTVVSTTSVNTRRDLRKHIAVCFGVGLWAALFTAFYAWVGAPLLLVMVMAGCTVSGLTMTVGLALGLPLRVAVAWITLAMFGACATVPFYYGGINFAGNAWLLVVPITAASMRSPRIAYSSTAGVCVVYALSVIAGELGMLPEPLFSVRIRSLISGVNLAVIAVLLLVIARLHFVGLRVRSDKIQAINQQLIIEVECRNQAQADLERTRSELMEAARFAGRAEVATGALHNIGNALTSVSVATARAGSLLQQQRIGRVDDLARLLQDHEDPRLAAFAEVLAKDLRRTQAAVQEELLAAVGGVDHVANVVAVQQEHARHGGLAETVVLEEEVRKAMVLVGLPGAHIVNVTGSGEAVVDRHRLLQILGNLMANARDAVAGNTGLGRISVSIHVGASARVVVSDNGVGIAAMNLERVFAHGFSTKSHGSGFGLHASAIAAHEMNGNLSADSNGIGGGATFTLDLPVSPQEQSDVVRSQAV